MSWHRTKKASKLPLMDKSRILVFDTETTGLEPSIDEILQITILDGYGVSVFDSYIKPKHHKSWVGAQAINHITPDMVKNAPTFNAVRDSIQNIFNNAQLIVGYNINFDINFIEAAGIVVTGKSFDVMTAFASYRADVDNLHFFRRCSLKACAQYFDYSFDAHDSAEDARPTLYCFNQLISDPRFTTYNPRKPKITEQDSTTTKKKTGFSVQFRTQKRTFMFLRGLVLVLIAETLFYLKHHRALLTIKELYDKLFALAHEPVDYLEYLILGLLLFGIIIFIFGVIRIIRRLPRVISVRFQKLMKKY